MAGVAPWISVEPSENANAILGVLPFEQGTVAYAIPATVVPDGATGILVFAWAALAGVNLVRPARRRRSQRQRHRSRQLAGLLAPPRFGMTRGGR